MSSLQDRSDEKFFEENLDSDKLDKWGWVIYRCTYKDDDAWKRFQQLILDQTRDNHARPEVSKRIADSCEWTFISDKDTLDGAKPADLVPRFRAWAAEMRPIEQPRADLEMEDRTGFPSQRYAMFVHVDEEALQSVLNADPDACPRGWVNLVRADKLYDRLKDQHDDEDEPDDWAAEHDYKLAADEDEKKDETFMRIGSDQLSLGFYFVIGNSHEGWYNMLIFERKDGAATY